MFSYYGTKKKIAKVYPKPLHETIIEPFAGAAMYSLYDNNWEKNVILNEKYIKVYNVWDYLINQAKESDIKNLPDLVTGLNLNTITTLSDVEKDLLGFYCNPSSAQPKKTVTPRGEKGWINNKQHLLNNIHKVKHWKTLKVLGLLIHHINMVVNIIIVQQQINTSIITFYLNGVNREMVKSLFVKTVNQTGYHLNH